MSIQEFKSQFSQTGKYINFNNAGQANISLLNRATAGYWLDRFYSEGGACAFEAFEKVEIVREKLAHFLGAHKEEIAFVDTTATGLSMAAAGISFEPGDEILTWDQEYPSNFYPWRMAAERVGAKVIQVESENWQTPSNRLLNRIGNRTKAIAISWVQYQTGSVTDLKHISEQVRGRNIWLIADIIQGVGVRPFHFHESGFDIVCAGSHKWLCSGYGAGFMAIRKERIGELRPILYGAMSFGTPETPKSFSIELRKDARRYEPGSKPIVEILALGSNLELWLKTGVNEIYAEACRLARQMREAIPGEQIFSPDGPIFTFALRDVHSAAAKFREAGIAFALRGPGVRLSLHGYNRIEDVNRLLDIID